MRRNKFFVFYLKKPMSFEFLTIFGLARCPFTLMAVEGFSDFKIPFAYIACQSIQEVNKSGQYPYEKQKETFPVIFRDFSNNTPKTCWKRDTAEVLLVIDKYKKLVVKRWDGKALNYLGKTHSRKFAMASTKASAVALANKGTSFIYIPKV